MYHIKRDGAWICGKSRKAWSYSNQGTITFKQAHNLKLSGCCEECKKRYYEILENLKGPIIVTQGPRLKPGKKSNQIIQGPDIKPYSSDEHHRN